MECRFPDKREEIKHNPEPTDATETVCSWRTLVWRQAACGQKYLRGWIKTFCHLTYLSPTPHRKFQELQSHSLKLASLDFYIDRCVLILHFWKHCRFPEAGMALISECTALARSWILVPYPLVVFLFCSHISLRCSHDLNAWNRLGSLKTASQHGLI